LPFDLLEAARALLEQSAIERKDGAWIVDNAAAASIDRHDVTNTVVTRARALPPDTLGTGAAFALWGDRTPLVRVAEALDQPMDGISRAVARLQKEGIVRVSDDNVSFVHDRMRVALLKALEPAALTALAKQMAERLRARDEPSLLRPALKFRI